MPITRLPFIRVLIALLLLLATGVSAGCAGGASAGRAAGELRGFRLPTPRPKPDFVLRDVDGRPFDFRRDTAGRLTLLFFGYASCPDICPVHLANLAAVLRKLPPAQAARVRVVFVTTDPARDTPERLRAWLAGFDPSFIGLTGTPEALEQAQIVAGVVPARAEPAAADSAYAVGHASQILAYTPDGLERAQYPFGTRQADWAYDIPLLLAHTAAP